MVTIHDTKGTTQNTMRHVKKRCQIVSKLEKKLKIQTKVQERETLRAEVRIARQTRGTTRRHNNLFLQLHTQRMPAKLEIHFQTKKKGESTLDKWVPAWKTRTCNVQSLFTNTMRQKRASTSVRWLHAFSVITHKYTHVLIKKNAAWIHPLIGRLTMKEVLQTRFRQIVLEKWRHARRLELSYDWLTDVAGDVRPLISHAHSNEEKNMREPPSPFSYTF